MHNAQTGTPDGRRGRVRRNGARPVRRETGRGRQPVPQDRGGDRPVDPQEVGVARRDRRRRGGRRVSTPPWGRLTDSGYEYPKGGEMIAALVGFVFVVSVLLIVGLMVAIFTRSL